MSELVFNCHKDFASFSLDVSFRLANELLVFFGPSGSGKSLTLRLLAGLVEPTSGAIELNHDHDVERWFDSSSGIFLPPEKRGIGMVFQNLALFPHMTVKQNILYPLLHTSMTKVEREQKVQSTLELFKLEDVAHKHVFHASGGQQQRTAIARAIINNPKFLLLDEPFSALDDQLRLEMHHILFQLRRDLSIPTILVTHNRSEAEVLADRIVEFSKGRNIN